MGLSFSSNTAFAAVLLVLCVAALSVAQYFRRRQTPQDVERIRRSAIHTHGKIGDCEIIDVTGTTLVYSYTVGGMAYTASQDLADLKNLLPEKSVTILGPASIKFLPRNPANSIVACEEWSGLRAREPQKAPRRA